MDTRPLCAAASAAPERGLLLDLLLYYCVWGEAANLRHAPELLWWLGLGLGLGVGVGLGLGLGLGLGVGVGVGVGVG